MNAFLDDARDWWRWWSVRIQMACAFITGFMWFEPSILLNVWNMMPRPVRALLPDNLFTALGAVLFALSLAGVLARTTRQPKLDAKRKDRVSANAE